MRVINAKSLLIIVIILAIVAGVFSVMPKLVLADELGLVEAVVETVPAESSLSDEAKEEINSTIEAESEIVLIETEKTEILEVVSEVAVEEVATLEIESLPSIEVEDTTEVMVSEEPVSVEGVINSESQESIPVENTSEDTSSTVQSEGEAEVSVLEAKSSDSSIEVGGDEKVSVISTEIVVSQELGASSLQGQTENIEASITSEGTFTTQAEEGGNGDNGDNSEISISSELSITTGTPDNGDIPERAVSLEFTFGTSSSSELAISPELAVTTESQDDGDPDPVSEIAISPESTFTSQSGTGSDPEIAISGEISIVTAEGATDSEIAISPEISVITDDGDDPDPETELAISPEITFTTSSEGDNSELAISPEMSFTTEGISTDTELAISPEISFTTDDDDVDPQSEIAISPENSFTTDDDGDDPDPEIAISEELTFTTDDDGDDPDPEIAISSELTFITSDDDDDDDDGGGGGGGGGRRHKIPPVPMQCVPYLKEFIRFGYPNNPIEVLKLKLFLNNYEGFNLPLTPIYDMEAYRAVEIFQMRYRSDVLNPWSTPGPTGFVYITTSLKINYIVCGITDSIDMKLIPRGLLLELVPAAVDVLPAEETLVPTIDGEIGSEDLDLDDFFSLVRLFNPGDFADRLMAGLSFLSLDGLWNWLVSIWDWCLIIIWILLLIILYLLYRNRRLKEELENLALKREVESVSEKIRESLREIKDQDLPGVLSLEADSEAVVFDDEVVDEYVHHDDLFGDSQKDASLTDADSANLDNLEEDLTKNDK